MINPYNNLYIYYFDGVPLVDETVQGSDCFLGTWVEETMAFLFFSSLCDDVVEEILEKNEGISLVEKYEMTGEQWHGDKIEPYCVESLCIYPPWNRPALDDETIKGIQLDPGVVFGTGRHQTTEDCLYLIHRLCTRHKIRSVLDIGTGTGLLSLGAAVLGCNPVMACDFNHLAVKTSLNNIRLNKFEEQILAFQAKGEEIMNIPCDLLVANIHYDVMRIMIESPYLLEKKWFILSGLLNSEAKKVLASLSQKNVHIIERRCPDGIWNTILGKSLE
ncbi:50S ribosomal protein L11 methyltransferase [Desulfobacula phenolica]|uniref:Ribosomal protein L11 methyltransferase n=1 Tax=Desulfobacula phenolica TaxID=90732 RepID=A0A1H2IHD4_9BACT|nr:50S ribosomal protein L11 methyltransferase [Desulfobacula phenolica]SDU43356.1 ribosomal protein L11 methyltransferase [Desulfobacula phenolica]